MSSEQHVEFDGELNYGINNFNNSLYSLMNVFIIMIGEGWIDMLYIVLSPHQYWNAVHPALCSFFMISCILFGNMILINLFLGLISFTFDRVADEAKKNILAAGGLLADASASQTGLKEPGDRSGDPQALAGGQQPADLVQPCDQTGAGQPLSPGEAASGPPQQSRDEASVEAPADLSHIWLVAGESKEGPASTAEKAGQKPRSATSSQPESSRSEALLFEGQLLEELIAREQEPLKSVFVNMQRGGLRAFMARACLNKYFSALRILFIIYNSVALGLVK